ncbi:hypothetical protein [uncultured Roseobacter sp.]|uniref:hypothetical protein n=1 Tax=uncultured Roseobacter sp. TaxID=114847 RepID=UPI002637077C|nr:hypothetical protein [uncultured Roseobacter sp.]
MKPNFALTLSFDRIGLLHRATGGWRQVGAVSPQASDLAAELGVLLKTATALAPGGIRSKLVIPDEQIRYLWLDTPGLHMPERRDMARTALDGATPYAINDLVYDVSANGNHTHVAAVALETLLEAEDFATQHGFNPISFVAAPEDAVTPWEPYFGPTRAARELLGPGQTVEPDGISVLAPPGSVPVEGPPPPTFRSARQSSPKVRAADAEDDTEAQVPSVTNPSLPPRETASQRTTFASRRSPGHRKGPAVYAQRATGSAHAAGFAEEPEPFVPKPRARDTHPRPDAKPPSEAARMTVFGARAPATDAPGRRLLPLTLGAIVVIGLVGVGTWSFGGLKTTVAGWLAGDQAETLQTTVIDVAPPVDQNAEGPVTPEREARLSDEDAAVLDALRAPAPDALRTSYAATGIWPQAPDVPSPPPLVDLEDLYIVSIDPIEPTVDTIALPSVALFSGDEAFEPPISPAAAGTTFTLDARGLVIASSDGTLNPDGVPIFAGGPPVRPAAFPTRSAETTETDAQLAAFRPQTRPADPVETTERAPPDGSSQSELAKLRPPARPDLAVRVASAAAASLVPLDNAASVNLRASNDLLARTASQRPGLRPGNFGQIVARAQRNTAVAVAPVAASVAPAVAPKIPTSASVAREATLRNAINLRRVNLIGVYGTPSARRALVRLSNGRYKKVQVGDRIDGGRVSAIGEGELRYKKGNRNLVLKMPQS